MQKIKKNSMGRFFVKPWFGLIGPLFIPNLQKKNFSLKNLSQFQAFMLLSFHAKKTGKISRNDFWKNLKNFILSSFLTQKSSHFFFLKKPFTSTTSLSTVTSCKKSKKQQQNPQNPSKSSLWTNLGPLLAQKPQNKIFLKKYKWVNFDYLIRKVMTVNFSQNLKTIFRRYVAVTSCKNHRNSTSQLFIKPKKPHSGIILCLFWPKNFKTNFLPKKKKRSSLIFYITVPLCEKKKKRLFLLCCSC